MNSNETKKYKVSSAAGLWEPITIIVYKGTIIESSVKKTVEIGADYESMKKYWMQFEGDNKYNIEEVYDKTENI